MTDISKPFVHRTCAALSLPSALAGRTTPADTAVIVKTSLNYGGKTERHLPPSELARLGMHVTEHAIDPEHYQVMRAADVPPQWWDDPALCIERYISNHQDRWHRAYVWRDRLCLREAINPALVKKSGGNVSIREFRFALIDGRYRTNAGSDPGPAGLLEQLAVFVPAIGLQFGVLDAVSNDDGEHYIIDVNTTPFFRSRSAEILDHLGGA